MNYKSFDLGDWIGHISGVIEDETTLDGNEMRDLVEFLTSLNQEPILDKIYADIQKLRGCSCSTSDGIIDEVEDIIDKYKVESEEV